MKCPRCDYEFEDDDFDEKGQKETFDSSNNTVLVEYCIVQ